jgi:TolB-like protein
MQRHSSLLRADWLAEEEGFELPVPPREGVLDSRGGEGAGGRSDGLEGRPLPSRGTSGSNPSSSSGESSTNPSRHPPAQRAAIVVLPFTNLSDDREQQYFADGITEDLTTDLSRLTNMFVISRNTAFTYRNKPVDTKQIGRELGVRYVLEESVRRSGNQLHVSAQLIDAETDVHLWAERFSGDTSDLFALQNEITSRLSNALGVELIAAEAARPTKHPDALDYILRGRVVLLKPRTHDTYRDAINSFDAPSDALYSAHANSAQRHVWQMFKRQLPEITKKQAEKIVDAWINDGLLRYVQFKDNKSREWQGLALCG